jgi:hypothetical protein
MSASLSGFQNADFGLRSLISPRAFQIRCAKTAFQQYAKTLKRGQGAECPDRLVMKKAAASSSIFWEQRQRLNTLLT